MKITLFDLKEGLRFTGAGAGKVEYALESFDKKRAKIRRIRDGQTHEIPTNNLFDLLNQPTTVVTEPKDNKKEGEDSMEKEINTVKSALVFAADDRPPLKPYAPLKKAPPKFPYGEYSVLPPDDARKVTQTLDALNDRAAKIGKIEEKATGMRVQTEEKIQGYKQEQGFDAVQQEMNVMKEKLATEVEETLGRVGKALIEHNNVLLTVYETVTEGKAGTPEVQAALVEAIKKYTSKDIAGKIIADADKAIAAVEEAKKKVERRLASWPAPEDLRKKIKQELPKKAEGNLSVTADIGSFFKSIVDFFADLLGPVTDALSSLLSSVDQAEPAIDEMQGLLADAGVASATASKKTAMFQVRYLPSNSDNYEIRRGFQSKEEAKNWAKAENLDNLADEWEVEEESVTAAKKTAVSNDSEIMYRKFKNRQDAMEYFVQLMGAEGVLDQLVRALGDDIAFDHFGYIARMNDMRFEELPDIR